MEHDRRVGLWLFVVICLIVILVVFGGWVRLTRSGLSMVEWNVVTGVIPPVSVADWDETFDKYRQTPEYKKVNRGLSLEEFKFIYYREYGHRILGRLTGLAFVVPLFVFLVQGAIPRRQIPAFLGISLRCRGLWGGSWSRAGWWTSRR
jgi:cytochrome c oxidase assembly protein subunit 15